MRARSPMVLLFVLLVGGCTPRAAETDSSPTVPVTPVASQSAEPRLRGVQSCASSGCHGRAFDGQTRDWRSAYEIWNQQDPHRRAGDVLYAGRSLEIYRNLHPATKLAGDAPDDAEYFAFLQQRCAGCHASEPSVTLSPASLAAGVGCESCHGPAGQWLDTHYLASFTATRGSTPGFTDTSDLRTRAAACVGCHIGPMIGESEEHLFDVNHDLIAAGHPRLQFELDAYQANLPKHWDEARDVARHERSTGGSFHVDAWSLGQEQAARQLVRQIALRQQAAGSPHAGPWPDLSNFDCYDCHHTIRGGGDPRPRAARSDGRGGRPRPALLPLDQLAALAGSAEPDGVGQMLSGLWSARPARWNASDAGLPTLEPVPRHAFAQHAAALLRIASAWKSSPAGPWQPTWDQTVQFYLAVQAFSRDLGGSDGQELTSANELLAEDLGAANFDLGEGPPGQYDSPTRFDPGRLQPALARIEAALTAIAKGTTGSPP